MLFSGFYSERQCEACGHKVARATPTSLLFFLMLVAGGIAVVVPQLARLYGPKWWYFAPVGGAELILVIVTLAALDWIRDRGTRVDGNLSPVLGNHETHNIGNVRFRVLADATRSRSPGDFRGRPHRYHTMAGGCIRCGWLSNPTMELRFVNRDSRFGILDN